MRILKYEFFKLILRKSFIVVLLVGMALDTGIFYYNYNTYKKTDNSTYVRYLDMFKGNYSKNKKIELNKILEKNNVSLNNEENQLYSNGEKASLIKLKDKFNKINSWVNFKRFINIKARYIEDRNKNSYNNKIIIKLNKMISNINRPKIINDLGWSNLFNYSAPWFIIGFILIIAISPIFSEEYSSGVDNLLLTCKNGMKKLVTSKIIASCLLTAIIFMLFLTLDLILNFSFYALQGKSAPIQSVEAFLNSPYKFKILSCLELMSFIKLLGCLSFAALIIFMSSKLEALLNTIFASGLILYLPFIIPFPEDSVLNLLNKFSYQKLINVNDYFNHYEFFNIFSTPVLYLNVSIIVFSLLTVCLLFLSYKAYVNRQITVEIIEEA